jgi:hypothetical protein
MTQRIGSVLASVAAVGLSACIPFHEPDGAGVAASNAETTTSEDEATIAAARQAFAGAVDAAFGADRGGVGPREVAGEWTLPRQTARMQAIHMVAIPSDPDPRDKHPRGVKVLIVNGSSNRDNADPRRYADVDNTGLFDPAGDLLRRIDSSPDPGRDGGDIDMFCSGQVQTYKGDVLFVGGTLGGQGADYGAFRGIRTVWLFDWREERWLGTKFKLVEGRWYPTTLPLADGRIAIIGGLGSEANRISHLIETYDPVGDGRMDVYPNAVNGPAGVEVKDGFAMGLMDGLFGRLGGQLDMYARLIPLRDGRYLVTGDGTGYGNRGNRNTSFLRFSPPGQPLTVAFQDGPDRGVANKFYGTQLMDPRPGKGGEALIMGGMINGDSLNFGADQGTPAEAQATADLSRYVPPGDGGTGQFNFTEDFLGGFGLQRDGAGKAVGGENLDRRMNHVATYLPTGDFLVLGGGMLGYTRPKFHGLLYRPVDELLPGDRQRCDFGGAPGDAPGEPFKSGFCRLPMNPHRFPRLYHTSAVLLPDGRVLLGGANSGRARWRGNDPRTRRLEVGPNPWNSDALPAEGHFLEVFSPPYMFAPDRPAIRDVSARRVRYGEEFRFGVTNGAADAAGAKVTFVKLGSTTHALDIGQALANLDFTANGGEIRARAPAAADAALYPPGYYMLFYVRRGDRVPSKGELIQLKPERDANFTE